MPVDYRVGTEVSKISETLVLLLKELRELNETMNGIRNSLKR